MVSYICLTYRFSISVKLESIFNGENNATKFFSVVIMKDIDLPKTYLHQYAFGISFSRISDVSGAREATL